MHGGAVEVIDLVGAVVTGEGGPRGAEGVAAEDLAAGETVLAMEVSNHLGTLDTPQLRRDAGGQSAGEELGAQGAIAEDGTLPENVE